MGLFFLSGSYRVDARLQLVDGKRLTRLRQEDLPDVAKAICGYERGLVRAERSFQRQVAFFRFTARGLDVVVLASDYAKILPYVQDGTFDPIQYPPPQRAEASPDLDPEVSRIDQWDPVFYTRVYGLLRALFPESYPISNL